MKTATVMAPGAAKVHESHYNADLAPWRGFFRGMWLPPAPRPQPPSPDDDATRRTVPVSCVLDQTSDAICVCNLDGVIEYWNHAAEALYGWRADEAVGRVAHALFGTVFPAPLGSIEAELMRTGRWQGELVHTCKDETRITVASRWALQRDDADMPVAVIETHTDISDKKRLEAERTVLEERLRQAEKMEAIGRFASGIAHDFNNILGAILGYGEIAKGKASDGRPIGDELDEVMQAGQRGKRLVEHILARARARAVCCRRSAAAAGREAARRRVPRTRAARRRYGARGRRDAAAPGSDEPVHQRRPGDAAGRRPVGRARRGGGDDSARPPARLPAAG
jgi:PAS domain S-box-containing protein